MTNTVTPSPPSPGPRRPTALRLPRRALPQREGDGRQQARFSVDQTAHWGMIGLHVCIFLRQLRINATQVGGLLRSRAAEPTRRQLRAGQESGFNFNPQDAGPEHN